jgi:site-specific DNA-adenine methylase
MISSKLSTNGGPLHYLGNRLLTPADLSGQSIASPDFFNEIFSLILSNNQGKKYRRCFEPFAGSAAWSFAAMQLDIADEYIINDCNAILMATLKQIKESPEKIKTGYNLLIKEFINSNNKTIFLQKIIELHNSSLDIEKAIILPAIINCSWSGTLVYDDKQQLIYHPEVSKVLSQPALSIEQFYIQVDWASKLLNTNKVLFKSIDFIECLSECNKTDLVLFDPPYPENDRFEKEKCGVYTELYGSMFLHQKLVETISILEKNQIHFYMTYGFYNPIMKNHVLRDNLGQPINYFKLTGGAQSSIGEVLEQHYFYSKFKLSPLTTLAPAKEILKTSDVSKKEALENYLAWRQEAPQA